ncbi:MAG: type II toxin-antitoxin system VapC family toxin [Verrucomicrobiota bacterium]
MKPKLYLETTIPSYLTAWPSRDLIVAGHQQVTEEWWRTRKSHFDIHISQLVLDEAADGDKAAAKERLAVLADFPLLDVTDEAVALAAKLQTPATLPPKAAKDAAHIAIAAVHGMHFLLTWNCTHINNAAIIADIERICSDQGFACPVICTPEELMRE